jgi:hypothetical protein
MAQRGTASGATDGSNRKATQIGVGRVAESDSERLRRLALVGWPNPIGADGNKKVVLTGHPKHAGVSLPKKGGMVVD